MCKKNSKKTNKGYLMAVYKGSLYQNKYKITGQNIDIGKNPGNPLRITLSLQDWMDTKKRACISAHCRSCGD